MTGPGASRHRRVEPAGPGDRLVPAGAAVFGVGVLAILADFVPFFAGRDNLPLALALLSFLAPVGLGLALAGLYRQVRAASRAREGGERRRLVQDWQEATEAALRRAVDDRPPQR